MQKLLSIFLSLALIISTLAGCAGQPSSTPSPTSTQSIDTTTQTPISTPSQTLSDEGSNYPVTIENNTTTITYEKAPERVVVLSYTCAEIMAALGLSDKVVALAPNMNRIDEVMEEYRDEIAAIPTFETSSMKNGVPNLETVLSVEPDFVYGSFYSFFATNCGEAKDYLANDIGIYASENTYTKGATLNDLYTEILNIGKIFDVSDTAEKIVDELKAREQAVVDRVAGMEAVPVFVFDYDNGDGTLNTTGGTNFVDNLIASAGGKDIFDELQTSYATISPEEIIAKDPAYVLTISYYTADDGQSKIDTMKNSADYAGVQAVKNDQFLSLGGLAAGAASGLQCIDALETLAQFLHPEAFAN